MPVDASLRIAVLLNPFALQVPGGDHAAELARELLGRGHTVRAFGAAPGSVPQSGLDPLPPEEAHLLDPGALGIAGFEPDVLLAYEALSPAAWMGARQARHLRLPLVLVEPGFGPRGHLVRRILEGFGRRLWGRTVRLTADAVVALDPVSRDAMLAAGYAAERVSVVPAGVDTANFRPGLSSGILRRHRVRGRVLLYSGRLREDRGVPTLLEAFARTVGQRGDWSLVLAGEGLARTKLRAQAVRLGVGSSVHFVGRPRPEELPGLMAASTLVAEPALDDGVRGKSAVRAMAAGVPVIASDLPRLRALVETGECGLLATPGQPAAWVEALQRAARDPEARRRWGRRGREIAEERLAWPRVAERFEATLQRAVAARHAEESRAAELGGHGSMEPAPRRT